MEYAVSAVWISIESLTLFFICKAYIKQKVNTKYAVIVFFMAFCITFVLNNLTNAYIQSNLFLKVGLSFIIAFFAVKTVFGGKWFNQAFLVLLWLFAISVADTVMLSAVSVILKISVTELVWKKWLYTIIGTAGKGVLLFAAWIIAYSRQRKEPFTISNKRLLLTTIFPVISLAMLCIIFDTYKDKEDLSASAIVFSIILGLSNALIIYLITSLDRASRAEQMIAMLNQSMQLQTHNYLTLERNYKSQRASTHEFKHQLEVIYGLLEQNQVTQAKKYIEQLQTTQTSRIFVVNTGHAVVDAILNEKYHAARNAGIDLQIKVNYLSSLVVETNAIVVLLSNLLDNAIEACQRVDESRSILCAVLLENDTFFVSIKNTSKPVVIIDGRIETMKEPKSEHGFGLAGVERVLLQLKGERAMEYANGWFSFVAEIPNK